jgi:predicted cupin superfamily sugar epimerase
MDTAARTLIETLGLMPHPEGGFYRETFRAMLTVDGLAHGATRPASTAIYYLLPAGTVSALHRVASDEVWHHYDGDPVELHTIDEHTAEHFITRLGRDYAAGERPQHVVSAGVWQAARPVGSRFALLGCTVAPGFDFADFEMPARGALLDRFPMHRALVESLTRE